ncbi:MAG: hypothetical protein GXP48_10110 [Acidobacteria bacterium]|nr:hypothetical protein [Acidobacteriota bacterium]
MGLLVWLRDQLRDIVRISDQSARSKAVEIIAIELEEMQNIFGLLVLGSFVGLPAPPMNVALDLMPFMEQELILMMEKVDTATTPVSELFSTFDVG